MNGDAQMAREWASKALGNDFLDKVPMVGYRAAARYILATTTPPTMADVEWDDAVHAGLCAEHPEHGPVRMTRIDANGNIWFLDDQLRFHFNCPDYLTPIPGTKIDLTPRREPDSSTDESSDGPGTINEDRNEDAVTINEDRNEDAVTINEDTVTAASIEDYKSGRVVDFDDKTLLPRPEDVPVGEVWEVECHGERYVGLRNAPDYINTWWLIKIDAIGELWVRDSEVTLLHRLVPESTPDHPEVLTTEEDYENAPTGTVVAGDYADPWVKHDLGFWRVCGEGGREISRVMALSARRVLRWGWEA